MHVPHQSLYYYFFALYVNVGVQISYFLHFTLLASFQDCKQFQGELFGICNLFRDLSDKLFTREIIELHKGQEQEHRYHCSSQEETTKLGNSFIPPKEAGQTSSSALKTRITSDPNKASQSTPVLEDLGNFIIHSFFLLYFFHLFFCDVF